MADNRPPDLRHAAYLLSLVAGILIFLGGTIFAAESALQYHPAGRFHPPYSFAGGIVVGILAMIFGFVIILLAMRLNAQPESVVLPSVLIIVFGAVSLAVHSILADVGFLLALIGGILGILWVMSSTARAHPSGVADQRACLACGAVNSGSAAFCQKCGKPLAPA